MDDGQIDECKGGYMQHFAYKYGRYLCNIMKKKRMVENRYNLCYK